MNEYKLLKGNNLELLKTLEANSIDAIVMDPPYALTSIKKRFGKEGSAPAQYGKDGAFQRASKGFMGKEWDAEVPTVEFWEEVYRVVRPGGHIISFGGTRTYHKMVLNCEQAGFEVRDCISWIYGSGFPKSLNIGKAIDKIEGNEREVDVEKTESYKRDCDAGFKLSYRNKDIIKGNSIYEGYGSALKPAQELILLARKPLSEKSIAENVLRWGTGGLNIDGCRIETDETWERVNRGNGDVNNTILTGLDKDGFVKESNELGRFPANIIFDEEAAKMLDEQTGYSKTRKDKNYKYNNTKCSGNTFTNRGDYTPREDEGGASRFFYCAKVSKKERNLGCEDITENEVIRQGLAGEKNNPTHSNSHPTVKPINLMTYLVRLVAPPTATILDPFMGSGSTGIAVMLEGHNFIGMEMDETYYEIAEARISNYEKYRELLK